VLLKGGPVDLACDLAFVGQAELTDDPGLKLLRDSVRSISVTFFGSQHHQTVLEKSGYQQYGQVLGQLNAQLGTPGFPITDYTVLTALTCMLLEVFLPTGPDNFMKHLQGIDTILAARGIPPSPIPPTTLAVLQGLRILSIVGGLHLAKPSIYCQEEWKRVPCFKKGAQGQLRHDLFSVMADCTRLMAERDAIVLSGDLAARHVFLSQVRAATLQLEAIHSRWQDLNLKHMKESALHFGEKRKIANTSIAIDYMLYNAAYIILLDIRETLEPVPEYVELRTTAATTIADCLQKRAWAIEQGTDEFKTIRYVATKVAIQVLGESHTDSGRKLVQMAREATVHTHCNLGDIPIQSRNFPSHDLLAKKCRKQDESEKVARNDLVTHQVPLQPEVFDMPEMLEEPYYIDTRFLVI
jgi:hypothetical protein